MYVFLRIQRAIIPAKDAQTQHFSSRPTAETMVEVTCRVPAESVVYSLFKDFGALLLILLLLFKLKIQFKKKRFIQLIMLS